MVRESARGRGMLAGSLSKVDEADFGAGRAGVRRVSQRERASRAAAVRSADRELAMMKDMYV